MGKFKNTYSTTNKIITEIWLIYKKLILKIQLYKISHIKYIIFKLIIYKKI